MQHDLSELLEQLVKVCQQLAAREPQPLHFVAPEDGHDLSDRERRESLLVAIKTQSQDASRRRLEAMAAAEKVRRLQLQTRVDPFKDELATYVKQHQFKRALGVDVVERERERKDAEAFRGGAGL